MATLIVSGFYYGPDDGGRCVFNVNGTPYVVFLEGISFYLSMFKKVGSSFVEQDTGDRPSSGIVNCDAALVGTTIHIAYITIISGEYYLYYVTYDCSSDQWGSPELAFSYVLADINGLLARCRIAVDSGGYPHIVFNNRAAVYHGTPYQNIWHIYKTSGGWQAVTRVSVTEEIHYWMGSIVMDSGYRLCVLYHSGTNGVAYHRSRNSGGTWDTEGVVHAAADNSSDVYNSIAVDTNDVKKAAIRDSGDDLDVRSGTSGANPTWSDDGTNIDTSINDHSIGVKGSGTDRYVLYSVGLLYNEIYLAKRENGAWSTELLETLADNSLTNPVIENPVRLTGFNYVFRDSTIPFAWYWNQYPEAAPEDEAITLSVGGNPTAAEFLRGQL